MYKKNISSFSQSSYKIVWAITRLDDLYVWSGAQSMTRSVGSAFVPFVRFHVFSTPSILFLQDEQQHVNYVRKRPNLPPSRSQLVSDESQCEVFVSFPCLTGFHSREREFSKKPEFIFFSSFPISRVYNYVINEDGQPMYLGSRTSVLYYNKTIPSWVW